MDTLSIVTWPSISSALTRPPQPSPIATASASMGLIKISPTTSVVDGIIGPPMAAAAEAHGVIASPGNSDVASRCAEVAVASLPSDSSAPPTSSSLSFLMNSPKAFEPNAVIIPRPMLPKNLGNIFLPNLHFNPATFPLLCGDSSAFRPILPTTAASNSILTSTDTFLTHALTTLVPPNDADSGSDNGSTKDDSSWFFSKIVDRYRIEYRLGR